MTPEQKTEFFRFIKARRDRVQIAAKKDLACMNDAVSRLPMRADILTDERAYNIMCKAAACTLIFPQEDGGDDDERWRQHFFPEEQNESEPGAE